MFSSDVNRHSPILYSACVEFCTTESVWDFYHKDHAEKDTHGRIQNHNTMHNQTEFNIR